MKRYQDAPFIRLGQYIQNLRQKKFASALSLFKDEAAKAALSFSYSKYADVERGMVLPTIEEVIQMAKYFECVEAELVMLWAQVQVPARLQSHFAYDPAKAKPVVQRGATAESLMQDLDNTWVFGPAEYEVFESAPHLIDVVLKLVTSFPNPVSLKELGGDQIRADVLKLVQLKRIHLENEMLTIPTQFFYIPKKPEWQKIRYQNMQRALKMTVPMIRPEQLQNKQAIHSMITTLVPESLLRELVDQIRSIEKKMIECESDANDPLYSFVGVLAPRKIDPTEK